MRPTDWYGPQPMRMARLTEDTQRVRVVAAVLYVGILPGILALAHTENDDVALYLWLVASSGLGLITHTPWWALLPFLAVPMAVPFGYSEGWSGHDPLPLWLGTLFFASVQAAMVPLVVGSRYLCKRF